VTSKTEITKEKDDAICSQALGQCWTLSQFTPMTLSWCTPLKSQLTLQVSR